MKRHESGYGMKIIMKPTATKKQIEIAKKMYPHALVIKEIDMPKVNFKQNELTILLNINSIVTNLSNEKTLISKNNVFTKNIYNNKLQNIENNNIMTLAS